MSFAEGIGIGLAVAGVSGFIGRYVTAQKDRLATGGALISFCLGPLDALVEALLPALTKRKPRLSTRMSRSG